MSWCSAAFSFSSRAVCRSNPSSANTLPVTRYSFSSERLFGILLFLAFGFQHALEARLGPGLRVREVIGFLVTCIHVACICQGFLAKDGPPVPKGSLDGVPSEPDVTLIGGQSDDRAQPGRPPAMIARRKHIKIAKPAMYVRICDQENILVVVLYTSKRFSC